MVALHKLSPSSLYNFRPCARAFTSSPAGTRHKRARTMLAMAAQAPTWTLVGSGRVGSALAEMGENDVVVKRGEPVPASGNGPIVVCTRNDDLQNVVDATPDHRRKDLIFIQNGMLQPWLKERGLEENTQVLVYFAVAKLGERPIDGKTDENPEGLTAAWGPHAEEFASRLHAHDLSCKVLDFKPFQQSMLEKLVWISAYMLVGVRHKVNVGEVEKSYHQEATDLITELAAAGAAELDVPLAAGYVSRLHAYSRSVAGFPTAIKEFPWRNGYFWALSQNAAKEGKSDPCPLHSQWLQEVGAVPS